MRAKSVPEVTDERFVFVRGDDWVARSAALARTATLILNGHAAARALLLCAPSRRSRWAGLLGENGARSTMADRRKFRELLDYDAGDDPWPLGAVTIASRDPARDPDVRASLSRTHWDVLIVDDAHEMTRTRARWFYQLEPAATRVFLTSPSGVWLTWIPVLRADTLVVDM